MRVEIDQQFGRIGISQDKARVLVQSSPGKLSIDYQSYQIELEEKLPALKIDLKGTLSDLELKDPGIYAKTNARQAQSTALAGIARIAREGDRMARIENGDDAIPQIARENYDRLGMVETKMGLVPKTPPIIKIEEGSLELKGVTGGYKVSYQPSPVQINATDYRLDVSLLRKPFLEISVGGNIDTEI